MKKIIIGLLAGTTLFTNFNFVFAEETTVEETTVQEEKEEKLPLRILDKEFPNDYKKWTDIVEINKTLHSISDYFGWEFNENNIEIIGDGKGIRIYPQELYEDGKGNYLEISTGEKELVVNFHRKFVDNKEKEYYTFGLGYIISHNKKEDISDLILKFNNNQEEYINNGFPEEFIKKIEINERAKETANNRLTYLAIYYTDETGVFNKDVISMGLNFADLQFNNEPNGSYEFPLKIKHEATAKKTNINPYIEKPKIIMETTIEETTVAEVVTTTAAPVEKKFDPNSYDTHKYEEVMRDRDGLMLQTWTFYAEVFQYFEREDGTAIALVTKDGDFDQIIMLEFLELPDKRLVEGDTIDVYGRSFGLTDYNTSGNSTNTVPLVVPDKVLIQGIDY